MITLLNKFDDNYIIKEKDILDVAASYVKDNNLEQYLSDIVFDPNNMHLGHYNLKTNKIVLNDEKIIKFGYKLFDKLQNRFEINENYYTYFLNFYYLYIIYHELVHVSQKARYESNINKKDDVFNYLFELCFSLHSNDNSFYKENHDFFPMEIDANNTGYLKAYTLMEYTKLPGKECKMMYLQYLHSLLNNYQKINNERIITPIDKLAMENGNVDINKIGELLNESKLSKIERMNLGLNITSKEYDSVIKEKTKCLIKCK